MKYFLMSVFFIFALCAEAYTCPDQDGDNVSEPCITPVGEAENGDGDNCVSIYNPEQEWPWRWEFDLSEKQFAWVKEKTLGLACQYDLNGDRIVSLTDLGWLFERIKYAGTWPVKKFMVGDFNGNGIYEGDDYFNEQCALARLRIYTFPQAWSCP